MDVCRASGRGRAGPGTHRGAAAVTVFIEDVWVAPCRVQALGSASRSRSKASSFSSGAGQPGGGHAPVRGGVSGCPGGSASRRHTSPRSLQGARQRPNLDRHGVKSGQLRSSSPQLLSSPIGRICPHCLRRSGGNT